MQSSLEIISWFVLQELFVPQEYSVFLWLTHRIIILKIISWFVTDRHSPPERPSRTSPPLHCTGDLPFLGLGSCSDTKHVDPCPQRNASTSWSKDILNWRHTWVFWVSWLIFKRPSSRLWDWYHWQIQGTRLAATCSYTGLGNNHLPIRSNQEPACLSSPELLFYNRLQNIPFLGGNTPTQSNV